MISPDSDSGKLTQKIYLFHDGNQRGPFDREEVMIFYVHNKIPQDSLYWKEGMDEWKPISELVTRKEKPEPAAPESRPALPRPRQHPYGFAYKALPELLFNIPEFRANMLSGNEHTHVAWMWDTVAKSFPMSEVVPLKGLLGELLPYDNGHSLLMVTFPRPVFNLEAYFVGAVIPRNPKAGPLRYFILSHSDASAEFGPAPGCIREITAGGVNARARDFVEATKEGFIAAIREICSAP